MHHLALSGLNKHVWQIDPHGRFKHWWDGMLVVLCLYVSLVVPYRIGFQIEMCPGMDYARTSFLRSPLVGLSLLLVLILIFF